MTGAPAIVRSEREQDLVRWGDEVLVPLYDRDGSIADYTLIDVADLAFVLCWRWHLSNGYAARSARPASTGHVLLHRELLGLVPGDGQEGDHRNRNKLDNTRENLRSGAHSQNMQNLASYRGGSSSLRGVDWAARLGKWRARIRVAGKLKHLGYFNSEEAAGACASAARAQLHPFSEDATA